MQIFVKPANIIKDNKMLNTLTFFVNKNELISSLFEKIRDRLDLSVGIYLIYAGKCLEENRRVNDYFIMENSTIILNVRPIFNN